MAHLIAPESVPLFAGAISLSGSPNITMNKADKYEQDRKYWLDNTPCKDTEPAAEQLACMRKLSVAEVMQAMDTTCKTDIEPNDKNPFPSEIACTGGGGRYNLWNQDSQVPVCSPIWHRALHSDCRVGLLPPLAPPLCLWRSLPYTSPYALGARRPLARPDGLWPPIHRRPHARRRLRQLHPHGAEEDVLQRLRARAHLSRPCRRSTTGRRLARSPRPATTPWPPATGEMARRARARARPRVVGQADHFRRRHLPRSCCGPWSLPQKHAEPRRMARETRAQLPGSSHSLARALATTPPGGAGFVTTTSRPRCWTPLRAA